MFRKEKKNHSQQCQIHHRNKRSLLASNANVERPFTAQRRMRHFTQTLFLRTSCRQHNQVPLGRPTSPKVQVSQVVPRSHEVQVVPRSSHIPWSSQGRPKVPRGRPKVQVVPRSHQVPQGRPKVQVIPRGRPKVQVVPRSHQSQGPGPTRLSKGPTRSSQGLGRPKVPLGRPKVPRGRPKVPRSSQGPTTSSQGPTRS